MTHRVEGAELVELLSYVVLKVPPLLREGLSSPDQATRRYAEGAVAERIAREMEGLDVTSPHGPTGFARPLTHADLPYRW